jgi:DNA-binding HxlR family transcriptional regulator
MTGEKTSNEETGATAKTVVSGRRSTCPVACALDLLGDRWTMLVIRDLFFGRTRFKDFTSSPEGIPTNILSERLQRLQDHGVILQIPIPGSPKRKAYELTPKGLALKPALLELRDWGLEWEDGTVAVMSSEPPA